MGMAKVYQLQRLNRLVKSHRPKFAGVLFLNLVRVRHLFLRFDPVVACNLKCQMCFFSDPEYRKNNKGIFSKEDIDRLAGMFFPRTRQVVFGCGAEPTLFPDYPDLVKIAKSYRVPQVGMVSNGQLFTEESIRQLVANGLDELMLSLHGVNKDSYESFMAGASYEKFHFILETLEKVKNEMGVSNPELRINYTVNSDNLKELRWFFEVFGKYNIHTLQLRPIMDCGQSGYRKFDLDKFVSDYNSVIDHLQSQCNQRGITFLARKENPGYNVNNPTIVSAAPKKTATATPVRESRSAPVSARQPATDSSEKTPPVRVVNPAPKIAARRAQISDEDYGSLALDSVLRFVSPQRVWRPDFDWRNETYDAFCKRIGFRKQLLNAVFADPAELARTNPFRGTLTLSYDVL